MTRFYTPRPARALVRIATRASELALWQSRHVAAALQAAWPGLATELVPITTTGDRILDRPLALAGGRGLVIKELGVAMRECHACLAVHSRKDVPMVKLSMSLEKTERLIGRSGCMIPDVGFPKNRCTTSSVPSSPPKRLVREKV